MAGYVIARKCALHTHTGWLVSIFRDCRGKLLRVDKSPPNFSPGPSCFLSTSSHSVITEHPTVILHEVSLGVNFAI